MWAAEHWNALEAHFSCHTWGSDYYSTQSLELIGFLCSGILLAFKDPEHRNRIDCLTSPIHSYPIIIESLLSSHSCPKYKITQSPGVVPIKSQYSILDELLAIVCSSVVTNNSEKLQHFQGNGRWKKCSCVYPYIEWRNFRS